MSQGQIPQTETAAPAEAEQLATRVAVKARLPMRERFFQTAALVIGLLGIPSLVWQFCKAWPPGGLQLQFFGLQAVVIGVFVMYGLGLAYHAPSVPLSDEPPSTDESPLEDE